MPAAPTLFLGDQASGKVLQWLSGMTDDGVQYKARAKTARVAPAGAGGECIFTALYLVITHQLLNAAAAPQLRITPVLDGVPQDGANNSPPSDERTLITLAYRGGSRVTELFEIGLSLPLLHQWVSGQTLLSAVFTGSDGTQLSAYQAETPVGMGFQGSSLNALVLQANTLRHSAASLSVAHAQTDTNIVDIENLVTIYADLTRPTSHASGAWAGLIVRGDGNATTTASGEHFLVRVRPLGNEGNNNCELAIERWAGGSLAESNVFEASFNWPAGQAFRYGAVVNGATLHFFTEPVGGGARTLHGAAWTPTASYNDTSHRRVGIRSRAGGSADANEWIYDNFTVVSQKEVLQVAATPKGRTAMRGTWFQTLVETIGALDAGGGDILIEAVELEYEVVDESTAVEE